MAKTAAGKAAAGAKGSTNGERYGLSKSMDKRLAAQKAGLTGPDFMASLDRECEDELRRRGMTDDERQQWHEVLQAGYDALRATLGEI